MTRLDAMTNDTAELLRIAAMVRRLNPNWRDAEGFYELRSEVVGGLNRLVHRLDRPVPAAPVPLRPPPPPAPPITVPVIKLVNGYARRCDGCGQPFHASRKEQVHCSNRCRQRVFQRKRATQAA
jgi:hypothetical protein